MRIIVIMDGREVVYSEGELELEIVNLNDLEDRICPICCSHVSVTEELISYNFIPKTGYKHVTVEGVDYTSTGPVDLGEITKTPVYKNHQICKSCNIDWEEVENEAIVRKIKEKNEANRTD